MPRLSEAMSVHELRARPSEGGQEEGACSFRPRHSIEPTERSQWRNDAVKSAAAEEGAGQRQVRKANEHKEEGCSS